MTENFGYLKKQSIGILILRITIGTMMILHGMMRVAGGIGIVTGYKFKIAGMMLILVLLPAFAYHLGSVKDFSTLMRNTWPLELAFVFLALYFIGPGKKGLIRNRQ